MRWPPTVILPKPTRLPMSPTRTSLRQGSGFDQPRGYVFAQDGILVRHFLLLGQKRQVDREAIDVTAQGRHEAAFEFRRELAQHLFKGWLFSSTSCHGVAP